MEDKNAYSDLKSTGAPANCSFQKGRDLNQYTSSWGVSALYTLSPTLKVTGKCWNADIHVCLMRDVLLLLSTIFTFHISTFLDRIRWHQ